jgi:threonine/homoserine/homoserine lactone efflux protein
MLMTFAFACLILAITPGPDNIFVATQSIAYGSRTGWMITLGLLSGCLLHTSLLAFGFVAIVEQWPELIIAIKLCGGGYLLYLAYKIAISSGGLQQENIQEHSMAWWYRKGVILNATNPKVFLFFIALFPAFLWDDSLSRTLQFFVLGGIFILISAVVFGLIALFAERFSILRQWLTKHPNSFRIIQTGIFALLGIYVLWP